MKIKIILAILLIGGGFSALNSVYHLKTKKTTPSDFSSQQIIRQNTTETDKNEDEIATPKIPTPVPATTTAITQKITPTPITKTAIKSEPKILSTPPALTPATTTPQTTATPTQPTPEPPASIATPACSAPIFTHHLTDITQISNIVIPPNFVNNALKTHSYIETNNARVPVYAPINMTLTDGAFYVGGPYTLDFTVGCGVRIRLAHITEPIAEIAAIFPDEPAQPNDSSNQKIKNTINFKAGDLIAYTAGTNQAGNWDFGAYDANTKNKYADDPNFNWSTIHTTAVCPYDFFAPELKMAYTAKYEISDRGNAKLDGESFCK